MRPVTLILLFAILPYLVGLPNTSSEAHKTKTITLTTLTDGALRQAVANAQPGSTITFGVAGTLVMTNDFISIDKDLTIMAPTLGSITLDGHHNAKAFRIEANAHVTLANLIFSGSTGEGGMEQRGGCILNLGTLDVSNSTLDQCYAASSMPGGAIDNRGILTMRDSTVTNAIGYWAGGLHNTGKATIIRSTFRFNRSSPFGYGGAIGNDGAGILDIFDSTIADNLQGDGAGIGGGGQITIIRSTIARNSGLEGAGGILSVGTLNVVNSTITGNIGSSMEQITVGGIDVRGTATIVNSTIARNSGIGTEDTGRKRATGGIKTTGTLILKNSLVALNTGTAFNDVDGVITSQGYNVIGSTAGANGFASTDLQNVDLSATLGTLGDNRGLSQTIPLLAGNPAINFVPVKACNLRTDQRGIRRPQGPACDSGAYEAIVLSTVKLIAPAGQIVTVTPTFIWQPDAKARTYQLDIKAGRRVIFDQWYDAAAVCTGDTCHVTPDLSLRNGNYTWRIRTSEGTSRPLGWLEFKVRMPSSAGAKATLQATPQGAPTFVPTHR